MKTLRQNAELNFRGVLSAIKSSKNDWCAQHYVLSSVSAKNSDGDLEKILFGLITEHLAEHEGLVFYCSDGDIILLTKLVPASILTTIAKNITQIAKDGVSEPATLIHSYMLGQDWELFRGLCEKKISLWSDKQKDNKPAKTALPVVSKEQVENAQDKLLEIGKLERSTRKRPCVMLIEDDQASLYLAKKALDGILSVTTAGNAADARKTYLNAMPDVVFLDIGLPDGSGHEVLHDILKLDHDAYVVMLSANSFEGEILKAMRHGAKGFVGKPFSRAKLLQYIYQSPHCVGFAASNRVV